MQGINASSLARAVPWALDQVKDGDTVTVTRGNIPDVETLERISTLLEDSIVRTDAICIENHRAGFPLRTLTAFKALDEASR